MSVSRLLLLVLTFGLLAACGVGMVEHERRWPVDISEAFLLDHTSDLEVETKDQYRLRSERIFRPMELPSLINRPGHDTVLRLVLRGEDWPDAPLVLELPGQFLAQTVMWLDPADGSETLLQVAGTTRPFDERPAKRGGSAFVLPPLPDGENQFLIVDWGLSPHNFSAYLWSGESWDQYLFNLRGWYGIFLGAMLVLVVYNVFLGITIRDRAYLYYAGYVLTVLAVVLLYSDLTEEYAWRDHSPPNLVLTLAGIAVFFGINFLNTFLDMPRRMPRLARLTQWISYIALVLAFILGFDKLVTSTALNPVFRSVSMHSLVAVATVYFLGVAIIAYLVGVRQARFLALSAVCVLGGVISYMLQTYGLVRFDHIAIHGLEFGVLAEGILLSLALADRISFFQREKEAAESSAKEAQREFTRRLVESQEADREAFSGAMHDSIGHGLLVMKQDLHAAWEQVRAEGGHESLEQLLQRQETSIGEVLAEVRSLSHDLHPHLLRRLGLAAAIESTLERALDSRKIHWYAEIEDTAALDSMQQLTVYRIVQESIANILKHADAEEVILTAGAETDGHWVLRIKDDGQGFDVDSEGGGGLGLRSMADRARLAGGWLRLNARPGSGTEVVVGLPLQTPR